MAFRVSEAQFTEFLTAVFSELACFSADGSIHFHCMDWRHIHELMTAGRAVYSQLKNLSSGPRQCRYGFVFSLTTRADLRVQERHSAPHQQLRPRRGRKVPDESLVLSGCQHVSSGRLDELGMHPQSNRWRSWPMRSRTARSGAESSWTPSGSGTTIIAAEQTGRHGYALELDPKYVDVAVRRWEKVTGENAVHADTGLTLDRLAELRGIALDGASRGEQNSAGTEVRPWLTTLARPARHRTRPQPSPAGGIPGIDRRRCRDAGGGSRA